MKTVTGNWVLPNNSPVAKGVVFFSLSADAALISGGGGIAPKLIQIPLDASGSMTATIAGNDELVPAGTQYTVVVNQSGGGRIYGPQIYSIFGASPISLNTLTPVAAGGPFFPTPIVASPTATQTIASFPLVVVSPLAVGSLTITAATATAATAGTSALPASPAGFVVMSIWATQIKVPYYNV